MIQLLLVRQQLKKQTSFLKIYENSGRIKSEWFKAESNSTKPTENQNGCTKEKCGHEI